MNEEAIKLEMPTIDISLITSFIIFKTYIMVAFVAMYIVAKEKIGDYVGLINFMIPFMKIEVYVILGLFLFPVIKYCYKIIKKRLKNGRKKYSM